VGDDRGPLPAQGVDQGSDVGGQPVDMVVRYTPRLVAQVVTSLVGHGDGVACADQDGHLMPPANPTFGKTVEQDRQGPVFRSGDDGVELNAVTGQVGAPCWHAQPCDGFLGQGAGAPGQNKAALLAPHPQGSSHTGCCPRGGAGQ
jgi:hypothetical protein